LIGTVDPAETIRAAEEAEVTISLKDHKFDPAEIKVPAARAIKLTVNNLDATPEEFESHPLGVEKVIAGKGTAIIRLKPLAKGSYAFRSLLDSGAVLAFGSDWHVAPMEPLKGIYAAGDCVETRHLVTGAPTYFPLGTTANKQGRVAGENAAGTEICLDPGAGFRGDTKPR
jgi:hypothetical protein